VRSTIYVAVGGTLMNKAEDEAHNLIEEMTLNNYIGLMREANPRRLEAS